MAMKVKEKKESYSPITVFMLVILLLYCFTFFYLMIWGIATSFKVNSDFFEYKPQNLFNSYKDYGKFLSGQIEQHKATDWDALIAAAKANKDRPLLNSLKQQQAALEETLIPKYQKWNTVQEQMGVAGLPFYTYKYTFKVFAYPVSEDNLIGLGEMYWNSILYAGGCGLAATFVPCIAAYACARFNYKFSRIMHTTVIIVMMIPIVGSQPSEIQMTVNLKMFDKMWCLWIMRANFLGLYFLMFYDICKALPTSFSEAAKMDGANNFQIFFKIAMPLIKNTFLTVFLIRFIGFWNEYQAPMIYTPSFPTVAMGLNSLMDRAGGHPMVLGDSDRFDMTYTPSRMAAAVLTAVPVCVLFACFQKRLLGNLTMGGIKG